MEDGGFFGFNTSLPLVKRGPQQEFGDVELEDTYDALNDETFGVINEDEDWEEEHEKLAEYIGDVQSKTESSKPLELYSLEDDDECAYPGPQPRNLRDARIDKTGNVAFEADNDDDAANVAASVSQIILDDDMEDIESIISRPINFSRTMESKMFGRMSPQSSIFDTDIVGSPSTPSIWSTQPSDKGFHKPVDNTPKVLPASNGKAPATNDVHNLIQNGLFKTVEDFERDLLNQPKLMTMEELERKILNQGSLNTSTMRSVEEIEAELTGAHRLPQPAGIVPLPPQLLQPQYMRLPPPVGMSMPPPMPLPMPMPLPDMRFEGPMFLPPQTNRLPPRFHPNLNQQRMPSQERMTTNDGPKQRVNQPRHVEVDESYDEYAGLMSTKEKQWLMSIQINQLISDNPYVDDYYFTVLRLRCLGKLNQGQEGKEGPKLKMMPERTKIETRTYAPTQFANSLGKLQVVTYTAPRRIIDVSIAQSSPESGQDPLVAVKDMRKFKQILLDIEKMYIWLLDLEDAEMRVDSMPEDSEPGPHHQAAADYQQKLQSFLSTGDRLQQIMLVRKGKVLMLRAWSRLTSQFQELIVKTMLLNCLTLIRRDIHDHVLVRFLPLVNDIFVSLVDLRGLVGMAHLIDASQKGYGYNSITSTKMGLDLISLIMCRGTELSAKCSNESVLRQWSTFVSSVGDAILTSKTALQSDLGMLNLEPFQQIGMEENQLLKLKEILDRLSSKNGRDS